MVSSREQALREIDFLPQIFKPDNILLNGKALTLQMRETRPDYQVKDVIAFATALGNIIEVGKIVQVGRNLDWNTISVRPLAEDSTDWTDWSAEFLQRLKKDNQKLFGYLIPNDTGRKLMVEVSLPNIQPALGLLPKNPGTRLDANNDKQITPEEVSQFVTKVRELIAVDKGDFQIDDFTVAEIIPESLDVTDVQLLATPPESYYFNDVTGNISRQGFFDIKADNIVVTKINHTSQEIERAELEDSMKDIRDRLSVVPGTFPFNDEMPWKTPSHYVNVIDKGSGTVIVRGEKIESIKKVKKCGKYYYRIGLADKGLVSTMHPGNFTNCLFTVCSFQPDDC